MVRNKPDFSKIIENFKFDLSLTTVYLKAIHNFDTLPCFLKALTTQSVPIRNLQFIIIKINKKKIKTFHFYHSIYIKENYKMNKKDLKFHLIQLFPINIYIKNRLANSIL